jgi:predicted acetyltransferase
MRWRIPPSALPIWSDGPTLRRFDPHEPSDLAALQAAYDAYCVRTSGSLSRSAAEFAAGFADDRMYLVGVERPDHTVSGYLKAQLMVEQPRPITLVVTELVALDDATHRALLSFLAGQADQIDFIQLDTPPDDPITSLLTLPLPDAERLDEPYEHHYLGRMFQGVMARTVNLASALRTRGYPGASFAEAASLTIAMRDPWLPENEKPVHLAIDRGEAHVTDEPRTADAAHLAGTVEEISRILVGGTTLRTSVRFGRVSLTQDDRPADDAVLDAWSTALALPAPYPLIIF